MESAVQRFIRHTKHRLIYRLGGAPVEKIPPLLRQTEDAFKALVRLGIPIHTFIDVGASNGSWSLLAKRHFPSSKFHLIEAQSCHHQVLEKLSGTDPSISYTLAAAADTTGQLYFDSSGGPFGGAASRQPLVGQDPENCVPCTTIDAEVKQRTLAPPFLIKLDTHGFELPILNGATGALKHSEALFIECYNFHPGENGLAFWEFCSFVAKLGFRPFDIVDPVHRPRDGILWQADILFLRSERPEFSDSTWVG